MLQRVCSDQQLRYQSTRVKLSEVRIPATFKDTAIGVIQKGGTDGEGTHQLIRTGGPSQTVTLISSVIDLDQYVGKKVKVYGQTLAAQKATLGLWMSAE